MLTIIQNYDVEDLKNAIRYLLIKASESELVRQLAVQIVFNSEDPISAIYDWVKANIRYTPDPIGGTGEEVELFISPVRMANDYFQGKELAGDCDDIAITTTALLRAVGTKSNVIIMDIDGGGFDHAISQALSEKLGKWIDVDPSSKSYPLGWQESCQRKVVV